MSVLGIISKLGEVTVLQEFSTGKFGKKEEYFYGGLEKIPSAVLSRSVNKIYSSKVGPVLVFKMEK